MSKTPDHSQAVACRSSVFWSSDVNKAADEVGVYADSYEDRAAFLRAVAEKLIEIADAGTLAVE